MVKYIKTDSGYFYEISDEGKKMRISKEDYEINKKNKKITKNTKMRGGAIVDNLDDARRHIREVFSDLDDLPVKQDFYNPNDPIIIGATNASTDANVNLTDNFPNTDGGNDALIAMCANANLVEPFLTSFNADFKLLRMIALDIYRELRHYGYDNLKLGCVATVSKPKETFLNNIKYYGAVNALHFSLLELVNNGIIVKENYIRAFESYDGTVELAGGVEPDGVLPAKVQSTTSTRNNGTDCTRYTYIAKILIHRLRFYVTV